MKTHSLLRRLNIATAVGLIALTASVSSTAVFAAATSNFQFTVNAGTLSVDIVDGSFVSVGAPTVVFTPATFSFTCQTPGVTGVFGTATQQLYVRNPDAADGGWTLSLAASSPAAFWDSAGTDIDFNDPATSGCTDTVHANDADTLKGQLTVDPSVGGGADLTFGARTSTTMTGITQGSLAAFDAVNASPVNSITLLTAAAGSDDIGDWTFQNIPLSQTIPAETPAASDYDIDMTLTII